MKSVPLALLAISIITAMMLTPGHASFSVNTYARTDKPTYAPGDTGILYITVKNQGTQAFSVKNISITYPWMAFITDHWDGNFTSIISPVVALAAGQTYNTQYSFTVPTDGRASSLFGGTVTIGVGTDIDTGNIYPTHATIQYSVATYTPLSLTSSLLPLIEIALLAVAVVMLALVFTGIRKLSKK
jgi:hypothetical protein